MPEICYLIFSAGGDGFQTKPNLCDSSCAGENPICAHVEYDACSLTNTEIMSFFHSRHSIICTRRFDLVTFFSILMIIVSCL